MIFKVVLLLAACSAVLAFEGYWGDWDDWSVCSKSCGGGQKSRSRQCEPPSAHCQGPSTEHSECFPETCPLSLPSGALKHWPNKFQASMVGDGNTVGTCGTYGSPSLISFDGADFTLNQKCSYILVQTVGHRYFEVVISTKDVSFGVSSVKITLQENYLNTVIELKLTGAYVDGVSVNPNPGDAEPCSGCVDAGGNFLIYTDDITGFLKVMAFDFQVVFGGLKVQLNVDKTEYFDNILGLCGNFNDNYEDEYVSTSGRQLSSLSNFLQEWKVKDSQCVRTLGRTPAGCTGTKLKNIEQTCEAMVDRSEFVKCFENSTWEKEHQKTLCVDKMCDCPYSDDMTCFCQRVDVIITHVCRPQGVDVAHSAFWDQCARATMEEPIPTHLFLLTGPDDSGRSSLTVHGNPPFVPTVTFKGAPAKRAFITPDSDHPDSTNLFLFNLLVPVLSDAGDYIIHSKNEFSEEEVTKTITVEVNNPNIIITVTPPDELLIGSDASINIDIEPYYWRNFTDGVGNVWLSNDTCKTVADNRKIGVVFPDTVWELQHRYPGWEFDIPNYKLCPTVEGTYYTKKIYPSNAFYFNKTYITVNAPTDQNGDLEDVPVVAYGGWLYYTFNYAAANVHMTNVLVTLVPDGGTDLIPMGNYTVNYKNTVIKWRVQVDDGMYHIRVVDAKRGMTGTEAVGNSPKFSVKQGFLCVTGVKETIPMGSTVILYLQVYPETLEDSLSNNGSIALVSDVNPMVELHHFTDYIVNWRVQDIQIPAKLSVAWDLSVKYRFVVKENGFAKIIGYSDTFMFDSGGVVKVSVKDISYSHEITKAYIGNEYGIEYTIEDLPKFVGKADLYLIEDKEGAERMLITRGANSTAGTHQLPWQAGMELAGWPPSKNQYKVLVVDAGVDGYHSGLRGSYSLYLSDACYGVKPVIELGVELEIFIRLDDETLTEINSLLVVEENAIQAKFTDFTVDSTHRFATWDNPELKNAMQKNTPYRLSFAKCGSTSCPSDNWFGRCGPVRFVDPTPESYIANKSHKRDNQKGVSGTDGSVIGTWVGICVAVVALATIVGLAAYRYKAVSGRREYERMATPAQPPTSYGTAETPPEETAQC